MKAVKRFKNIISHKRPSGLQGILGKDTRIVQPPLSISQSEKRPSIQRTRSVDAHDRRPIEQALVVEGVHREVDLAGYEKSLLDREDAAVVYSPKTPTKRPSEHDPGESPTSPTNNKRVLNAHPQAHRPLMHAATAPMPVAHGGRGQAHDPLSDHLYLGLGPGGSSRTPSPPCVSESPPAAEINIYETAYGMEVQRLQAANGRAATLFLTRRVERKEEYQKGTYILELNILSGIKQTSFREQENLSTIEICLAISPVSSIIISADPEMYVDERFMRGNLGDAPRVKSGFARVLEEARIKAAKGEKPPDDQADSGADDERMDD